MYARISPEKFSYEEEWMIDQLKRSSEKIPGGALENKPDTVAQAIVTISPQAFLYLAIILMALLLNFLFPITSRE